VARPNPIGLKSSRFRTSPRKWTCYQNDALALPSFPSRTCASHFDSILVCYIGAATCAAGCAGRCSCAICKRLGSLHGCRLCNAGAPPRVLILNMPWGVGLGGSNYNSATRVAAQSCQTWHATTIMIVKVFSIIIFTQQYRTSLISL